MAFQRKKLKESKKNIQSETDLMHMILKWIFQAKGTCFLIILNVIIYIWSLTLTAEQLTRYLFTPESLFRGDLVPMVTSWFLHADLTHLLGNLILLFIFGRVIEKVFGTFRLFIMYFTAAIFSDLISGLVFQQGGIGASGAISGLIGAAILVRPFYLSYLLFGIPIPIVIIGWLGIFADISGLLNPTPGDNIGHIAHLAGFFVLSLWLYITTQDKKDIQNGLLINIATICGAILFYVFFPELSLR